MEYKMNKLFLFTLIQTMITGLVFANTAPTVTNVTASQRTDGSGVVDIAYTLNDPDGDKCTVSVAVSDNGGLTFAIIPSSGALSGALTNVSNGRRQITWNSKLDLPGVFGSNYRIKVTADDISLTDGLVVYWSFDDGTAIDNSGNGNNGTIHEATPIARLSGGQALYFDGNDYIIKNQASNLPQGNSAKSINVWFKRNNTNGCYIVAMDDGSDIYGKTFAICFSRGSWVVVGWADNLITYDWYTSVTDPYNDDKWHMITVTYNGTTTKLYIDGLCKDSSSSHTYASNLNTIWVGKAPSGSGPYFSGSIDQVRIYNRALSDSEILSLYQSP
jgi:hypothetical protein